MQEAFAVNNLRGYSEGRAAVKILNLLAKLGILRYGATAAIYRTGKDRPSEFMMPGVANAKRDIVTGWDFKTDAEREADAAREPANKAK
jgi:hypothetical protein